MAQHRMKFVNPNSKFFARNLLYASTLRLPFIEEDSKSGTVVVVGSGPSLTKQETLDEIKRYVDEGATICACKKAIRWLHERGFPVHMSVSMDPGARMAFPDKIMRLPDCTYYIANTSAPELFQYLENNKVVVWHSACGYHGELNLLKHLWHTDKWVGGGFNVCNRAIGVVDFLGYRKIILAGCDSGYREGETFYCDGMTPTVRKVPMTTDEFGSKWWSAPDMIASAVEIAKIARVYDQKNRSDEFVIIGDTLPKALRYCDDATLNRCAQMIPKQ